MSYHMSSSGYDPFEIAYLMVEEGQAIQEQNKHTDAYRTILVA
jgi:hypothetical protein